MVEPNAVGAPPTAVRVKSFSLWYGEFRALDDVSAEIPSRKVTGLIGPSGCGKTTLLRSINRINERYDGVRTSGEILVQGKNVLDPDVSVASLRKEVGMVFQKPNPLPISIYENVVFGLRSHVRRRDLAKDRLDAAVEAALAQVDLWTVVKDRLHVKATTLTLEQQQKLCIARLLPLKPRVLLMDEPCSALDAEGIARIEELITKLRDDFTIIIVTHSMSQATRVSDDCIFMLLGEIVEHRSTQELFAHPRDARTADYVAGRYG